MSDKKRYNYMENVLQEINRKVISLDDNEVKRNNRILESILTTLVNKMKEQDPLFKAMYQRVFYGGSYYDGLRVGKPEEFDLDLLMKLPTYAEPVVSTSNNPGFVHVQLKSYDAWIRQPEAMPAYRTFANLFDKEYYLDTDQVLSWIQGIITKALNTFPKNGDNYIISNGHGAFSVKTCKGGPAHTLKISGSGVTMDVDLVACFVFRGDKWPSAGFRPNPVASKPEFFIVPKKPKANISGKAARYWRLSFQEQERVLMDSKLCLKPTIKLLKKLRDEQGHGPIASYYIKTAVLHITETKPDDFWRNSLSYCFMTILKEYKEFIERGKIPYYWNKNNNLIGGIKAPALQNIASRLNVIISDIDRKPNEPKIVAKYLLNSQEQLEYGVGALKI